MVRVAGFGGVFACWGKLMMMMMMMMVVRRWVGG
jgi:hypothetical protein